ncbi:restriction endonuclease subunit S [Vibrio diabolicus]|uniref:restriction endonuclease subunit S n=1 Tax=Vibrio diabolicus TaxID=50719 RepID=UPI0037480A4B
MTEQMNVPKLRFGDFEGEWSAEKLGAYSKHITYGLTVRPKFVEDGIPLISAREITSGEVKYSKAPQISLSEFNNLSDKAKPLAGDLFLSKTGTIGFSAQNTTSQPIAITQNIAVIRIDDADALSPNYVLHYFKTKKFYRSAISKVNQSTIMDLQLGDIKRLPIPIPPNFLEQQKIASFLSKVDEKIALLTEKKDKLTEYKKGVMQQLFNGKWEEQDGQLTFIPPTLRFKADDGSEFPDWVEKTLGSLADLTSSKRVYLSDYSEDGVPFFRGKEISEIRKGIIPDDVLYITRKAFEEFKSKYGAPVEGDILVTAVGTLGNILRVTGEFEFYFKDGNLIWLRKPRCDSKFLSILMEANQHELLKTAIGSSQKALTIVELKKIVFKMPSLEEQQKITMFLSSLEEKVRLANSELEKAKEWKKGLLQQMFV